MISFEWTVNENVYQRFRSVIIVLGAGDSFVPYILARLS